MEIRLLPKLHLGAARRAGLLLLGAILTADDVAARHEDDADVGLHADDALAPPPPSLLLLGALILEEPSLLLELRRLGSLHGRDSFGWWCSRCTSSPEKYA